MTAPQRIQMRRTKGWRKPEGAIYVGRPSQWGNPWRAMLAIRTSATGDVEYGWFSTGTGVPQAGVIHWGAGARACVIADSVSLYAIHAPTLIAPALLSRLGGHDLACWCPLDQPCHADVLLRLANP